MLSREEVLEQIFRNSKILKQTDSASKEYQNATERLKRAGVLAEEEDLEIQRALIEACKKTQATEANSLAAQQLGVQPAPSK